MSANYEISCLPVQVKFHGIIPRLCACVMCLLLWVCSYAADGYSLRVPCESCDRDHIPHKTGKIYCLGLSRKSSDPWFRVTFCWEQSLSEFQKATIWALSFLTSSAEQHLWLRRKVSLTPRSKFWEPWLLCQHLVNISLGTWKEVGNISGVEFQNLCQSDTGILHALAVWAPIVCPEAPWREVAAWCFAVQPWEWTWELGLNRFSKFAP